MDSREMFLVMGYGETPLPEIELVSTLDEAFNAVARMIYGDPSPSELLEARADFYDFEERVRDGLEWHAEFEIGGIHAWKVCVPDDLVSALAAQTAAPQFDMLAHLQRQRVFSEHTFGPGKRTKMVADHIRKELIEIEAKPSDLTEWVDVILLALDGAWRSGATAAQIVAAIQAKQTKNEGRMWPDWRTADPNKAIEHDRSRDITSATALVAANEHDAQPIGDELTRAAISALRSYQYGNASHELAKAVADKLAAARTGGDAC